MFHIDTVVQSCTMVIWEEYMSSTNKIVTIDASKARAEFFKILDDVYQGKKSYVI